MKCNDSLLYLLQELTFNLVDLISHKEYKDFVLDSLKLANYFVLVCYHLYKQSGEKYLPQTIESVDVETIEAYVSSYRQLLAENNQLVQQLSALDLEQVLKDPMIANYFGELLQEIKLKQ